MNAAEWPDHYLQSYVNGEYDDDPWVIALAAEVLRLRSENNRLVAFVHRGFGGCGFCACGRCPQ